MYRSIQQWFHGKNSGSQQRGRNVRPARRKVTLNLEPLEKRLVTVIDPIGGVNYVLPDNVFAAVGEVETYDFHDVPQICTGTLIRPQWVLTAAHCIAGLWEETFVISGQRIRAIENWATRAWFEERPRGDYTGDIGLLRLERPVEGIAPLPMFNSMPQAGERMTIAGYGNTGTGTNGETPRTARQRRGGEIVIDRVNAMDMESDFRPGESNSAHGDSGGPLIVRRSLPGRAQAYFVAGVVSSGEYPGRYGQSSSFTRVDAFVGELYSDIITSNGNYQLGGRPVTGRFVTSDGVSQESGGVDTTPPSLVGGPIFDLFVPQTRPDGAEVWYPEYTVFDDMDFSPTVTYSHPNGSVFPVGTTQVLATAVDAAGNEATGYFYIAVQDTEAPPAPSLSLVQDTGATNSDGVTRDGRVRASCSEGTLTVLLDGQVASSDSHEIVAAEGDGTHRVQALCTDAAGNTSERSLTFTLDTTASLIQLALVNDTGADPKDRITRDGQVWIDGGDGTVMVTVDGQAVVLDEYGRLTVWGDGLHRVEIVSHDAAGNEWTAELEFTLDTQVVGASLALVNDTGVNYDDRITRDGQVWIDGGDGTVMVTVDGQAVILDEYGRLTVRGDALHRVEVISHDAAGNEWTAELEFTLDTQMASPSLTLVNDTGRSGNDGITKDGRVRANCTDGTLQTLLDDVTATPDRAGIITATSDGQHVVRAVCTDAAGNEQRSELAFQLDTQLPTVSVRLRTDSGSSNSDRVTNDGTVVFGGDAEGLEIVIDGSPRTKDADGMVRVGGDGSHRVAVAATDLAGNTGTTVLDFVLDTILPNASVSLVKDSGASANDRVTNDRRVAVVGEESTSVKLDGVPMTVDANGQISASTDGSHKAEVTSTDAAGNSSTAVLDFVLDTTGPKSQGWRAVQGATGNTEVVLDFDERLGATSPPADAFKVLAEQCVTFRRRVFCYDAQVPVVSAIAQGNTVKLALGQYVPTYQIRSAEVVNKAVLADLAGNTAGSSGGTPANPPGPVPAPVPVPNRPTLQSWQAVLGATGNTEIVATFNQPLTQGSITPSAFTITARGYYTVRRRLVEYTYQVPVGSVTVQGSTVRLALGSNVSTYQIQSVDYSDSSGGSGGSGPGGVVPTPVPTPSPAPCRRRCRS